MMNNERQRLSARQTMEEAPRSEEEEVCSSLVALQAKRIYQLEQRLRQQQQQQQQQQQKQQTQLSVQTTSCSLKERNDGSTNFQAPTNVCPKSPRRLSRRKSGSGSQHRLDNSTGIESNTTTKALKEQQEDLEEQMKILQNENEELVDDVNVLLEENDVYQKDIQEKDNEIKQLKQSQALLQNEYDKIAEELETLHNNSNPNEMIELMSNMKYELQRKERKLKKKQLGWEKQIEECLKDKSNLQDELYQLHQQKKHYQNQYEELKQQHNEQLVPLVKTLLHSQRSLLEAAKFSAKTAEHSHLKAALPASNLVIEKVNQQTQQLRHLLFHMEQDDTIVGTINDTDGRVVEARGNDRGSTSTVKDLFNLSFRSLTASPVSGQAVETTATAAVASSSTNNNRNQHMRRGTSFTLSSAVSSCKDRYYEEPTAFTIDIATNTNTNGDENDDNDSVSVVSGSVASVTSFMKRKANNAGQWFLHDNTKDKYLIGGQQEEAEPSSTQHYCRQQKAITKKKDDLGISLHSMLNNSLHGLSKSFHLADLLISGNNEEEEKNNCKKNRQRRDGENDESFSDDEEVSFAGSTLMELEDELLMESQSLPDLRSSSSSTKDNIPNEKSNRPSCNKLATTTTTASQKREQEQTINVAKVEKKKSAAPNSIQNDKDNEKLLKFIHDQERQRRSNHRSSSSSNNNHHNKRHQQPAPAYHYHTQRQQHLKNKSTVTSNLNSTTTTKNKPSSIYSRLIGHHHKKNNSSPAFLLSNRTFH